MHKDFIDNLFAFAGVGQGDHKLLLRFLLQTDYDLDVFMEDFFDGDLIHNIISFQRYKRRKNQLSEVKFKEMFEKNKKIALEHLLQEPISNHQIKYLSLYELTYKDIYRRFQNNPTESFMGLIKSVDDSGNIVKEFDDDFLLYV